MNSKNEPTIVLVHGAFSDASSWMSVIGRLRSKGTRVVAAANLLRGVEPDTASLSARVKLIDGPVILVGHSYGGVLITNAGTADNVKGLVYVAAAAPDVGENVGTLAGKFAGSLLTEAIITAPLPDGVELYVKAERYGEVIAADLNPEDVALAALSQRPASQAALVGLTTVAAWKTRPSWFVYGDADRTLPAELHAYMAERANSRRTVLVKGASHSVMLSRPDEVVEVIAEAAMASK